MASHYAWWFRTIRVREAVERRHIYVREDPRMLAGYPIDLGSSVESAPALADLDGDGVWEVVIASGDGTVHVVDGTGQPLPGWPVRVGPHPGVDPAARRQSPRRSGYGRCPDQ